MINSFYCLCYSHSGQQCCYDFSGDYTTDNNAAGSADYYYPLDHYLLHQSSDYFPYRACCVDSEDIGYCDLYYQVRPTSNSTCHSLIHTKGMHVRKYIHDCFYHVCIHNYMLMFAC